MDFNVELFPKSFGEASERGQKPRKAKKGTWIPSDASPLEQAMEIGALVLSRARQLRQMRPLMPEVGPSRRLCDLMRHRCRWQNVRARLEWQERNILKKS